MSLILFAIIALVLFGLAFFTRRRFGVLGLALCAGVVLSTVLTDSMADIMQITGLGVPGLSSTTFASALLILLPPVVLMVGGPKYQSGHMAVIGSILYALFAVVLLLSPLSGSIAFDSTSQQIVDAVISYQSLIIAGFVILALLDTISLKTPKLGKKH